MKILSAFHLEVIPDLRQISMFCIEIIKKEEFLDCKLNKVENSNGNYNFFDFVNKVSYYFRYNNNIYKYHVLICRYIFCILELCIFLL